MRRQNTWRQTAADILGINRRNLDYVYAMNARERFPLVDDKIRAKEILGRLGLPIPEAIAEIERRRDIEPCLADLAGTPRFVVKPASGFGGAGIRVVVDGDRDELAFHMAAILSGMYAFDSLRDRVLVEEFVEEDPVLHDLHGGAGVSDVRVIVCDSQPVMAMLRVPCEESRPTANLHRGGIGAGIDFTTGRTTFAIRKGRPLAEHPDTRTPLEGIEIPHWEEVVAMTRPLNRAFGLGYLGADIVLHKAKGPLLLEVNARPGLSIQLANRRGLRPVLQAGGSAASASESAVQADRDGEA